MMPPAALSPNPLTSRGEGEPEPERVPYEPPTIKKLHVHQMSRVSVAVNVAIWA